MNVQSTTNGRPKSRRLVLYVADLELVCFSVPVKLLKPCPAGVVPDGSFVTGRKIKIDREYPDNLDFTHGRFSFDL